METTSIFDSIDPKELDCLTFECIKNVCINKNIDYQGKKKEEVIDLLIERNQERLNQKNNDAGSQTLDPTPEATTVAPTIIQSVDTAKFLTKYSGAQNEPLAYFIDSVDRAALLGNWDQKTKMCIAAGFLEGQARNWYDSYGRHITNWDDWKASLRDYFHNTETQSQWQRRMEQRVQKPHETISEYVSDKMAQIDRTKRTQYNFSDQDKIDLIIDGIYDLPFKHMLKLLAPSTPLDLLHKARDIDETNRRGSSQTITQYPNNTRKINIDRNDPSYTQYKSGMDKSTLRCFRCRELGHMTFECQRLDTRKNQNNYQPPQSNRKALCHIITTWPDKSLTVGRCSVDEATEELDTLFDGGANTTMIDEKLVQPDAKIRPNTNNEIISTGNGPVKPTGYIDLHISIDGFRTSVRNASLMQNPPFSLILGNDWRRQAGITCMQMSNGDMTLYKEIQADEIDTTNATHFTSYRYASVAIKMKSDARTEAANELVNDTNAKLNELDDSITPAQKQRLKLIMFHNKEVFTYTEKLGKCTKLKCTLPVADDTPIRQKSYRYNATDTEFIKQKVIEWQTEGIIEDSTSPYNFPICIVEQPNHPSTPRRIVVNLKKLNDRMDLSVYQMPTLDQTIDEVAEDDPEYFNTIDIKWAFFHIDIEKSHRHRTAFNTPVGHKQFCRMPNGLNNAPLIMQSVMDSACNEVKRSKPYMDDVGQSGRNADEAIDLFEQLLKKLIEYGLKTDLKKCQIVQREVKFLGYIIDKHGRRPDPDRCNAIDRYQNFNHAKDVKAFLGFASYFRKFVKNFASKTMKLQQLTRKDSKFQWTEEHKLEVETIKQELRNNIQLAHFRNDAEETIIAVDASYNGLGASLEQIQNGQTVIVAFASKAIPDSYKTSHSNELECLAAHWAITEKFRFYVHGLETFTLITDNWTLAHLTSKAEVNRKFARWILDLQGFRFKVKHRKGKENALPDALSRTPNDQTEKPNVALVLIKARDERLKERQLEDGFCKDLIDQPTDKFQVIDGILCKKQQYGKSTNWRIVIPGTLREELISRTHVDAAHADAQKTKSRLERKHWWPNMSYEIAHHVRSCHECQTHNKRTKKADGLLAPRQIPTQPFDAIGIDHAGPYSTSHGYRYILVFVDIATRFVIARPTKNVSTATTIRVMDEHLFQRFGKPTKVYTDSATNFLSQDMTSYLHENNIAIEESPPYHHQANGLVERTIQTIVNCLRKFDNAQRQWSGNLQKVIWAINTNEQSSSKFAPFELVHAYFPRLDADVADIDLTLDEDLDTTLLTKRTEGTQNIRQATAKQKERYDKGRSASNHEMGEMVLYSRGTRKRKFDELYQGPYPIAEILGNETYVIQTDTGRRIKVHAAQIKKYYSRNEDDTPDGTQINETPRTGTIIDPRPDRGRSVNAAMAV